MKRMLRLIFVLGCVMHFSMASAYNLCIIFKLPDRLPELFRYVARYQDLAGLSGGIHFMVPA
ncbi:hypothetical protein KUH03_17400 [Sphingobacterium sp. E70]|uniref:hypothetical protein n=1 Tax=Sphingobacterium sp. E70 TaxID=2853439 RepID=UPI00211B8ECB|nr:hypothetical protein [Sphingobacterium sp. E70]ULT28207.1 hypothetical protein KUH03_17400 [Sphingobacterium sp. E70]